MMKSTVVFLVVIAAALTGCTTALSERAQSAWLDGAKGDVLFKTSAADGVAQIDTPIATRLAGFLQDPGLTELSGLAASAVHQNTFWAINDSGNAPRLFALNSAGKRRAVWQLPISNTDWEDIATFTYRGQHWIMLADVGDNLRRRSNYQLHFIVEPMTLDQATDAELKVAFTLQYQYDSGAHNVESVAVSAQDESILLISKTARHPTLFEIPLQQMTAGTAVATAVGKMRSLFPTRADGRMEMFLAGGLLLTPTAMDISADNNYAIVGNYRHVYLYQRQQHQSWSQVFRSSTPKVISSHRLKQSESIAFAADGQSILVGSEGYRAPLLSVRSNQRPVMAGFE